MGDGVFLGYKPLNGSERSISFNLRERLWVREQPAWGGGVVRKRSFGLGLGWSWVVVGFMGVRVMGEGWVGVGVGLR